MTQPLRNRSTRGVALVVVLLSLALLAAVAMGITTLSSGHVMQAHSEAQSLEALYAAQAGARIKLGQVRSGDLNAIGPTVLPATGATYDATVAVGPGPGAPPFPPDGTYYVEATGTSAGGHVRRVSILASLTQSRWNHAAFGDNSVTMKSGSYTDSFDSSGGGLDHSKATIATNNASKGIVLEDKDVVVGWANSDDLLTGKKKKSKKGDPAIPIAEAEVQGPPGSVESGVVDGKGKAGQNYLQFANASQVVNMDPVTLPGGLPAGPDGSVDPLVSPYPSVTGTPAGAPVRPGVYHDLTAGSGDVVELDVSLETPGSTVQYIVHAVDLSGGRLRIKQPAGKPVTVQVYLDTGSAATGGVDNTAGVRMSGASMVNKNKVPLLLQFLIAGEGENVLEGHDEGKGDPLVPEAYYVVYAPEGKVKVTRGHIYGSVVADEVKLDGDSLLDPKKAPGVIHFDLALLKDTGNPPLLNVLSIQKH